MGMYGHRQRVCTKSWLQKKNPLQRRESNLPQRRTGQTLYQLSYIPIPFIPCLFQSLSCQFFPSTAVSSIKAYCIPSFFVLSCILCILYQSFHIRSCTVSLLLCCILSFLIRSCIFSLWLCITLRPVSCLSLSDSVCSAYRILSFPIRSRIVSLLLCILYPVFRYPILYTLHTVSVFPYSILYCLPLTLHTVSCLSLSDPVCSAYCICLSLFDPVLSSSYSAYIILSFLIRSCIFSLSLWIILHTVSCLSLYDPVYSAYCILSFIIRSVLSSSYSASLIRFRLSCPSPTSFSVISIPLCFLFRLPPNPV